jgi:hypothetical protein
MATDATTAATTSQSKSEADYAKAFDVPPQTSRDRLTGITPCQNTLAKNRKLSDVKVETLRK